jgi:hypothetical protein
MRIIVAASVVAALLSPATAQNNQLSGLAETAQGVYASCRSMSAREGFADAAAACACVTGYMGGMMSDRDFEIAAMLLKVGEMTENGASEAAIEAAIMAFFERGFTEADVQRVAAMVEAAGARGDAVCGMLDAQPSV